MLGLPRRWKKRKSNGKWLAWSTDILNPVAPMESSCNQIVRPVKPHHTPEWQNQDCDIIIDLHPTTNGYGHRKPGALQRQFSGSRVDMSPS